MFSQQDSRWGMKRIGNSPYVMAGSGCAIVSLLDGLNAQDDPGQCLDKLNAIGAFSADGQINWWKVHEAYPEVSQEVVSEQTDLKWTKRGVKPPSSERVTDMGTALAAIRAAVAAGKIVILSVDLSPHNGLDEGDHFVHLKRIEGDSWIIGDPWFGWEGRIDVAHDGFAGYGSPASSVYGYRILTTMTEHLNLEDKTLVKLAEAGTSGELAYYKGGKLLRGSQTDVLATWANDHYGVPVTLKQFNQFPHYDIKNPNNSIA